MCAIILYYIECMHAFIAIILLLLLLLVKLNIYIHTTIIYILLAAQP